MKRHLCKLLALPVALLLLCGSALPALATQSTSYTFSQSTTGEELAITDDAFLPAGAYLELGLNAAQDLEARNGLLYIADTGNKRVLVLDPVRQLTKEIGVGILNQPQGVAADDAGRIYVADYANNAVYRFSAAGELELTFERPTSALYGETAGFSPRKVAPDGTGGVYIVVDGTVNGLVQMDKNGEFLGYYASNTVNKSLYAKFLDIFLTDEQLSQFVSYTPDSFGNLMMGSDGLVYTVCMGKERTIQKHSLAGTNVFAARDDLPLLDDIADICMSPDGYIYIFCADGMVTELTRDGYMLYAFGAVLEDAARLGLTASPAGVGVDENHNVYLLDKTTNTIQVYRPTASHDEIIRALNSYQAGHYDETKAILENTLKYNSTSYFAHLYLGLTYMHEGDYETAAAEFKSAKNWEEYSNAYWDIRNDFLQSHLIWILLAVVLAVALLVTWRSRNPRPAYDGYAEFHAMHNQWQALQPRVIRRTILHPVDTAYQLRAGYMGRGYIVPLLTLLVGYVVFAVWRLCSGPIFSVELEDFSLFANFGYYAAIFGLFVLCNFLIVSILDGESSFLMILSATGYAMLPFILTFPILTLIKNFLTLDEALITSTLEVVIIGFCLFTLFLMLKIIHAYSVKKLIGTLLLTVFLMALVVLFGSLLYLLCKQIVDFFMQLYMEVVIRG